MSSTTGGATIGIDLGTTNSCIAIVEVDGSQKVIENLQGKRTTPSCVAVSDSGERIVGEPAKNQLVTNSKGSVFAVKRLMGAQYDSEEVQRYKKSVPYEIVKGQKGEACVKLHDKVYTPGQISAFILQELKKATEERLGQKVTKAVITVPAYFNDAQRQATKDAGTIAGLEVKRIINEPTAAALSYGLDKGKEKTIVVYDLGGGTFDVSVLHISDGVFEVKSTNGDTFLGGEDFDSAILNHLIDNFKSAHNIDLKNDKMALQRLKEAAEKVKIELSSAMESEVNLPYITVDSNGPKHLNLKLTRSKLESLVDDLAERTLKPCQKALEDAGLSVSDIDDVVLVGGMTRMPLIQKKVEKFFNKAPHKGVNPDEVVALGAAVQVGIFEGSVKDVLLLDVTPLSLGIETMGGVFTKLIERNTAIPTKKSQIFSTAADNQSAVTIKVYQGEREMATHNKLLGHFNLENIPPAPRGMPQIEVMFDIDANGITHVSAKDKATGKEQRVTIQSSSTNDDEIEKMRRDAEDNMEADKQRRELVEAKNDGDSLVYQTNKMLSEHGTKVDTSIRSDIESKVSALQKTVEQENDNIDIATLKQQIEDVQQASMKLGEAMYKDSQNQTDNQGASDTETSKTSNSDDNVVDAEFEEVDSKNDK